MFKSLCWLVEMVSTHLIPIAFFDTSFHIHILRVVVSSASVLIILQLIWPIGDCLNITLVDRSKYLEPCFSFSLPYCTQLCFVWSAVFVSVNSKSSLQTLHRDFAHSMALLPSSIKLAIKSVHLWILINALSKIHVGRLIKVCDVTLLGSFTSLM